MPVRLFDHRTVLLAVILVLAFGSSGCMGCGGEPERPPASALLRAAFPEQAALVLEGKRAFTPSDGGFALRAPETGEAMWGGAAVDLPRGGTGVIRISLPGDFEVRVRETGLDEAEATLTEGAVAYRRAGGTSFWTASSGGVEEWLHLDAGAARGDEALATWEVEGAALRLSHDVIEVVDSAGLARLHVTAPMAYAPGGREVAVRLGVRENRIELFVNAVDARGEELLVDPSWAPAGPLNVGRYDHTATVLQNGKVLVTGGITSGGSHTKFAEIYDPATNIWTFAASMGTGRRLHTAALLSDGRVLVTGGLSMVTYLNTAEVYDPVANTWTPTAGTMTASREYHTATTLPSGKVLIVGGYNGSYLATCDLYDPVTNTFSATGALPGVRWAHTATLLANGKVLVTGGSSSSATYATGLLYDPAPGTWSSAGSMTTARISHAATLLANGKVLVSGGNGPSQYLTFCELYDPVANAWSLTGSMLSGRYAHTATLLGNGQVLVAGGTPSPATSAELYDPATTAWGVTASMATGRMYHQAVLLSNGKALVAGGQSGSSYLTSVELYTGPGGISCAVPGDCMSGFCVDGYCCDTACGAGAVGDCEACNLPGAVGTCTLIPAGTQCRASTGACDPAEACTGGGASCPADVLLPVGALCRPAQGPCDVQETCTGGAACPVDTNVPNGTPCSDGNACTQTDICQSGVCAGGGLVVCPMPDACHNAGVCNPATGVCSNPAKADGTPCSDGNACTQADACQSGICAAGNPIVCAPLDDCHVAGVCNPASGLCSNPAKPDGAMCDDGNLCTQADACKSGFCLGGNVVVCMPVSSCHNAGVCNPMTGVCSNPAKPDGAACDDADLCTQVDTCQFGVCTGQTPVVCSASDACHDVGVCAPNNGICSSPTKPDGTPCPGGVCKAGACNPVVPDGGSGSSGGPGGAGGAMGSSSSTTTGGAGGNGGAMGTSSSKATGSSSTTTGSSSTATGESSGSAGGGSSSEGGGCGCGVAGSPAGGAAWMGLSLLLLIRRRRLSQ